MRTESQQAVASIVARIEAAEELLRDFTRGNIEAFVNRYPAQPVAELDVLCKERDPDLHPLFLSMLGARLMRVNIELTLAVSAYFAGSRAPGALALFDQFDAADREILAQLRHQEKTATARWYAHQGVSD